MKRILPLLAFTLAGFMTAGRSDAEETEKLVAFPKPIPVVSLERASLTPKIDFYSDTINTCVSIDLLYKDSNISIKAEEENQKLKDASVTFTNPALYVNADFQDFSGICDPLLLDSNILKSQIGLRGETQEQVVNSLNQIIFTTAYIQVPNMRTRWDYHTPLEMIALNVEARESRNINLDILKLNTWMAVNANYFFPFPEQTQDFQNLVAWAEDPWSKRGEETINFPFEHLKASAGLDLLTKFLDLGYEFTYDQTGYSWNPAYNYSHALGLALHNANNEINYKLVSVIKPAKWGADTTYDFSSAIDATLALPQNFYLKTSADINHSTKQTDVAIALGQTSNLGTFEAIYSSANNSVTLTFSNQKKSQRKQQNNQTHEVKPVNPTLALPNKSFIGDRYIRSLWGEKIQDVIPKINNYEDLLDYASYFGWQYHEGTYTAQEIHEQYGLGVCRDFNGQLIPFFLRESLGKDAYGLGFKGPFMNHMITLIKTKEEKYDVVEQGALTNSHSYSAYYQLNAPTEIDALMAVYPGFYTTDRGDVTRPVSAIRDAVEEIKEW